MAHQLGNGRWRVLIRRKGRPTIDRTFDRQDEAERFEAQSIADLNADRALWSPSMTLAEAARQYMRSTLFTSKTLHTQTTERTRLKPVLDALGKYSLEALENGQRIAAFRDRRASRVSPKTQRRVRPDSVRLELAALSAVFLWAVENRIVTRNPLRGMHRPRGKPRRRRVFEHEQLNMVAAMYATEYSEEEHEAARFICLQRELGCRPGELAAVRRADIDLDGRALTFRDTKDEGRDRTVHLTTLVVDALAAQLVYAEATHPDSPFVFTSLSRTGKVPVPINYRRLVQMMRDLRVVDPDFHAHACRREFTSAAFENGMTHADVMRVTGHRSYAAVQMYNVSENLHPRARKRLDEEAKLRAGDRARALAEHLGIPLDELRSFIAERKAIERRNRARLAIVKTEDKERK